MPLEIGELPASLGSIDDEIYILKTVCDEPS
jgi:hypothetical protein